MQLNIIIHQRLDNKNYIDIFLNINDDVNKFTFNLITQDFYNNDDKSIFDYLPSSEVMDLMHKINKRYYFNR